MQSHLFLCFSIHVVLVTVFWGLKIRHKGTGTWFLWELIFQDWVTSDNPLLWVRGSRKFLSSPSIYLKIVCHAVLTKLTVGSKTAVSVSNRLCRQFSSLQMVVQQKKPLFTCTDNTLRTTVLESRGGARFQVLMISRNEVKMKPLESIAKSILQNTSRMRARDRIEVKKLPPNLEQDIIDALVKASNGM